MKKHVYVFIEHVKDGTETFVGIQHGEGGPKMPLVFSDDAIIPQVKPAIQAHVDTTKNQVSMVRFESRRLIELFTPGSGKYQNKMVDGRDLFTDEEKKAAKDLSFEEAEKIVAKALPRIEEKIGGKGDVKFFTHLLLGLANGVLK